MVEGVEVCASLQGDSFPPGHKASLTWHVSSGFDRGEGLVVVRTRESPNILSGVRASWERGKATLPLPSVRSCGHPGAIDWSAHRCQVPGSYLLYYYIRSPAGIIPAKELLAFSVEAHASDASSPVPVAPDVPACPPTPTCASSSNAPAPFDVRTSASPAIASTASRAVSKLSCDYFS